MPEFVMEGRDHGARQESAFVLGFIEAMFFTNQSQYDSEEWQTPEAQHAIAEGMADGNLPCDVGFPELDKESLAEIRAYCEAFQSANAALLESAYETGYDETQAGHDLWFTSQGHGVGYWDRELGDIGDKLSDAARYCEMYPEWCAGCVTVYGLPPVKESAHA